MKYPFIQLVHVVKDVQVKHGEVHCTHLSAFGYVIVGHSVRHSPLSKKYLMQ